MGHLLGMQEACKRYARETLEACVQGVSFGHAMDMQEVCMRHARGMQGACKRHSRGIQGAIKWHASGMEKGESNYRALFLNENLQDRLNK